MNQQSNNKNQDWFSTVPSVSPTKCISFNLLLILHLLFSVGVSECSANYILFWEHKVEPFEIGLKLFQKFFCGFEVSPNKALTSKISFNTFKNSSIVLKEMTPWKSSGALGFNKSLCNRGQRAVNIRSMSPTVSG